MGTHCTLTSEGLQDWFTDPDGWICRFSANVNMSSRLQSKRDHANLDHTCENCSQETKTTKNSHTATQTRPVTPILHDVIVNGLLIAQKRKDAMRNDEFLNIFEGTDEFAYYDYVLLTTVKENGRKHILKYIRSKI